MATTEKIIDQEDETMTEWKIEVKKDRDEEAMTKNEVEKGEGERIVNLKSKLRRKRRMMKTRKNQRRKMCL